MRRRLLLAAIAVSAGACRVPESSTTARFEGETMGTTYVVQLAEVVSQSDRISLARDIRNTLDDINQKMSNYIPGSELSRFNRAPAGTTFRLSADTFEVLLEGQRVSELTAGAFDITVAPLVRAWGFGPESTLEDELPSGAALDAVRAKVGFRHLSLDDDPPSVTKDIDGLECDLSAIAKGYAVDRVAELLDGRGSSNYMVEVGGEVRTSGKNEADEAWRIGIEKPLPGVRELQRTVSLSGLSLATSGDYRNFYEVGGRLYSHLIDPRDGRPVTHRLASVSVVDHTCTRADALASGLLVLGPEAGYELAVKEDLAVLFLIRTSDGAIEEVPTPSFEALFF